MLTMLNKQTTEDVAKNAASDKFGFVLECENGILLIKRAPAYASDPKRPYMTIEGGVGESGAAFFNGHYDLTLRQALDDFEQRAEKAGRIAP